MINITIDNFEYKFNSRITVLQACEHVKAKVPRFCYHDFLAVAGNCRMCLVELEGSEKPLVSCVAEIENGMSIRTNSLFVKKARESILELIMLNHPLDCPICDQGGECDLQDQLQRYGRPTSRYYASKKAQESKDCGAIIYTQMSRCILCTRCVRFFDEYGGGSYFGTANRGSNSEIIPLSSIIVSELAANVADICPVGALTTKRYRFTGRAWDLSAIKTIDLTDSVGTSIIVRTDYEGFSRVHVEKDDFSYGSLITDKARFSPDCDKLPEDLATSYVLNKDFNKEPRHPLSILSSIAKDTSNMPTITLGVNQEIDCSSLHLFKVAQFKTKNFFIRDLDSFSSRLNYYLKPRFDRLGLALSGSEKLAVLVGCNTRFECASLNARLRYIYQHTQLQTFVLGASFANFIPSKIICLTTTNILSVFEGKSYALSGLLMSLNPTIFIGASLAARMKNVDIFINKLQMTPINAKIIDLGLYANTHGAKYLNISRGAFIPGSYTVSVKARNSYSNAFFGYLNKNVSIESYTKFATSPFKSHIAVTPYQQEYGYYMNVEGRLQVSRPFIAPKKVLIPGEPCTSQTLVLSTLIQSAIQATDKCPFETQKKISPYIHLEKRNRSRSVYNLDARQLEKPLYYSMATYNITKVSKYPIKTLIKDFYQSSNFTAPSKMMRLLSRHSKSNRVPLLLSTLIK